MPYRNEVQPLNLFGDYVAGQRASIDNQGAQQANALRGLQVQRAQAVNALAQNPQATPEQFVRAGDAQTGMALDTMNQRGQVDKQQAVQQLAGIAQKALTITDPVQRKGFLQQAGQIYGPAFQALGADMSQFPAMLAMPDDQLAQRLQQVAQMAQPKIMEGQPGATFVDVGNPYAPKQVTQLPGRVSFEDAGGSKVPVDSVTGMPRTEVPSIAKTPTPAQAYTADSAQSTAQMIVNGQIPMLTGMSLKTPFGQDVAKLVKQMSDQNVAGGGTEYTAGDFPARAKAMRDFNTGAQGNAVRFMNTAISHINTLEQLGTELNSGSVPALNKLKNLWKTQTGQAAPSNFTAARDIVANEVVKAVTASGGGVADRQEAQAQISAASSWDQLAGVAGTWKQLLAGQLGSLRLQYEQGTGLKDFNKKLYPETLKELGAAEGAPPAAQPAADVPTATGPNGQKLYLRNGQWAPQ